MGLLDTARAVADRGRSQHGRLGLALYTVTVSRETWSGPIADDVTLVSSENRVLVHVGGYGVRVRRVSEMDGLVYGAGTPFSDATGRVKRSIYVVGPITPTYDNGTVAGGYSIAQLLPPVTSPVQRVVYVLQGPGLLPAGEPFEIVKLPDDDRIGHYNITVARVPIVVAPGPH